MDKDNSSENLQIYSARAAAPSTGVRKSHFNSTFQLHSSTGGMGDNIVGCKSCGFAFCKECIHGKKVPVPRVNNEKHKVCHKCFNIITGKEKPADKSAKYSPPEAYKKRVAALESGKQEPKQASPSVPRATSQKPYYPPSMGKEDIALAERLEKLKAERRPDPATLPNQQEIEQRLGQLKGSTGPAPAATDLAARAAVLQGKDPAAAAAKQASSSSGRGEVDDLLTQVMEEVELDNQALERFNAVENRLNRLKGTDSTSAAQPSEKPAVQPSSTRQFGDGTSAEHKGNDDELQALISQVAAELELDAQKAVDDLMKDKDIAERLAKIKDKKDRKTQDAESESQDDEAAKNDPSKLGPEENSEEDEENEEEAVKRIIQQALEEQKLDEAAEEAELGLTPKPNAKTTATDTSQAITGQAALGPPPAKPQMEDFEEEFPWCCICNGDASLRCHGCDDDLYCKRCYREGHERFEMEDHETSPFKQSGKKS